MSLSANYNHALPLFIKHNAMAIEVKIATTAAVDYLKQFFPNANNIQLEEIEISEDERFWSVTLSYEEFDKYNVNFNRQRKYKIFKIDANTGGVLSMKIRELL